MLPPINPLELAKQFKHYDDNLGPGLLAATYTCVACATLSTALRFWARHISGAKFLADDWTILVSLAAMWGLGTLGVVSVRDGLGKHAVRVGVDGVFKFLKHEYTFEQVYCIGVSMTKISILLFYLRLFRGPRFKRLVYAVGVFVVLWAITTMVPALFQCRPVNYFWNRRIDGKCINSVALIISTAITNVITDFIIWIMPFPLVWKLHLPLRQKIALCGIFLLGGFVCIAGVVRLRFLWFVSNTVDPTYVNAPGGMWSTVEPCIGVVCANSPVLRPLFQNYISKPIKSLKSSNFSSSYHKYAPWSTDRSGPKDKDIPMTASATWFSQGSTQVSSIAQRNAKLMSPMLSSDKGYESTDPAKPVIWGGRVFRPHKDSRFAEMTQASAMESRDEPEVEDSISEIIPANGIRVRREVVWASYDKPLPPLPPPEPTWRVPQRREMTFDEIARSAI